MFKKVFLLLTTLALLVVACNPTAPTATPTATFTPEPRVTDTPQPAEDPVAGREDEDPQNIIYGALFEEAKIADMTREELPGDAITDTPFEEKEREDVPEPQPPTKIHPLLREWLDTRPDERDLILIVFADDMDIPRFPEPAINEPRDSGRNRELLARADALVAQLTERRAGFYQEIGAELKERYEAEVIETFWLIRGMVVEMPIRAVAELAEREDILYLQPNYTQDEPPQNGNNADDVDDGRARMNSDPYFNLGQTGGFIGLLDTGVRFSHVQFNSPDHVDFARDCVNGGANCNTGGSLNPNDDCWNHGTSSAGIITGNDRSGAAFRGVTAITLDSFKVYPTSFNSGGGCNGFLDSGAAVRGFQEAVRVLDRVIVAEMQGSGDYFDAIAVAADNAFDAGAVIIAANGNNGPNASTVNVPAVAHRVLGVGNFDVQSQNQVNSQSRGPAGDNRIKPDIQAPTNAETASNASDTALRTFGGTSGATPFAAGAAALLRNWLRGASFSIDPGQVYAQMILSGQQTWPFNNTSGAGPLRLPTDGWAWWGKVTIARGQTIDIPITISGENANTFDAALWWPEWAQRVLFVTLDPHNDIDLYLIDPSGNVQGRSISVPSVFERAQASGRVANGRWILRIRAYNMETDTQVVYWASHVRLR